MKNRRLQRKIRHSRIRKKLVGTLDAPRLSVFRSNKHIYAQLIDDTKSQTLVSASSIMSKTKDKLKNLEKAKDTGKTLAQKAVKKNIKKVIFDRGGYKFHGRIKSLAEGAREGGLDF